MDTKSFTPHDHRACISEAVLATEEECLRKGLRLTDQRRRVLEILLSGHKALGAYEILEILRDDGLAAQPPVAYRALDFLVANGFAHKVERLNAFIACAHPGETHAPALLICQDCKAVAEMPSSPVRDEFSRVAKDTGFEIATMVVEAIGICPSCRPEAS